MTSEEIRLRIKAIDRARPTLTTLEIAEARKNRKLALSLKMVPVFFEQDIPYLAVKFALADGTFATVLLDRLAAMEVGEVIEQCNELGWSTEPLTKGPVQ